MFRDVHIIAEFDVREIMFGSEAPQRGDLVTTVRESPVEEVECRSEFLTVASGANVFRQASSSVVSFGPEDSPNGSNLSTNHTRGSILELFHTCGSRRRYAKNPAECHRNGASGKRGASESQDGRLLIAGSTAIHVDKMARNRGAVLALSVRKALMLIDAKIGRLRTYLKGHACRPGFGCWECVHGVNTRE